MSNSRLSPEEIRTLLVKTAKTQFLEKGIVNTEMKDIAALANISRSTLYRHIIDRNQLAFLVSIEILTDLHEKCFSLSMPVSACGFEKLSLFMHHLIDTLCQNVNLVSYLSEFDCLFRGDYPDIPEAKNYIDTINRMLNYVAQFLFEGLADNSIKPISNPLFFISVLINTIFGIAQRVLPRDAHYAEEHHTSGRELMTGAIDIMLESVANKK